MRLTRRVKMHDSLKKNIADLEAEAAALSDEIALVRGRLAEKPGSTWWFARR